MKTIYSILFLVIGLSSFSQNTMNIHKADGTVLQVLLNDIDSITYTINNSSDIPIIQSVTINQEATTGGTNIVFTIVAESNAPVDWLNSSFYGPNGNIHGGGSGVQFTETSTGIWEYTRTDFVSEWAPSGEYYYNNISVENAGELESDVWASPVTTTITN